MTDMLLKAANNLQYSMQMYAKAVHAKSEETGEVMSCDFLSSSFFSFLLSFFLTLQCSDYSLLCGKRHILLSCKCTDYLQPAVGLL